MDNQSEIKSTLVEEDDFNDETVTFTAFGHRFSDLLPGHAENLVTLEREGAIYGRFWEEANQSFGHFRIPFLPGEIFEYVEGHLAMERFDTAMASGTTFEEALAAIGDDVIAQRVRSYNHFGTVARDAAGNQVDIRGCFASFLTIDLELLVCGQRRDRYQRLPDLGTLPDRRALITEMLEAFPVIARHMERRSRNRPPFVIENEYDVQDLLYSSIRSVFIDAVQEEWTPSLAGTAKRIDVVIPSIETIVETKMVRNRQHAKDVIHELMIDFECYHTHPACGSLMVFMYDPQRFIADPDQTSRDLSGLRQKGNHTFTVAVIVR